MEDKKEAKKRKGSAERMAKMRERQSEKGLKQTLVPATVADGIKAAGSWEAWLQAQMPPAPAAPEVPAPTAPEPIPVPAEILKEIEAAGGWDSWFKAVQAVAPTQTPSAPKPDITPENQSQGPAVPAEILAAVQVAGGWDQWIKKLQAIAPSPTPSVPKPAGAPDKIPKRRQLNAEEKKMMEIGFSVLKLTGWRRRLADWLIGS